MKQPIEQQKPIVVSILPTPSTTLLTKPIEKTSTIDKPIKPTNLQPTSEIKNTTPVSAPLTKALPLTQQTPTHTKPAVAKQQTPQVTQTPIKAKSAQEIQPSNQPTTNHLPKEQSNTPSPTSEHNQPNTAVDTSTTSQTIKQNNETIKPETPSNSSSDNSEPVRVSFNSISYKKPPKPNYPETSRDFGEKGTVLLEITIGSNGNVLDAKIHKSSGYGRLDKEALKSIKKAQFIPYKENGLSKTSTTIAPITFGDDP